MQDIIPQDATPMKRCLRCPEGQQWHPATSEFFDHYRDGLQHYCKTCRKQYRQRRRIDGPIKEGRGKPRKKHQCTQCGESDPSKFPAASRSRCKKCDSRSTTLSKYRLSAQKYQEMFETQFGLCALCGLAPKNGRLLVVDHCHASGVIRGLLCYSCNNLLGLARDSQATLRKAIKYLQLHTT